MMMVFNWLASASSFKRTWFDSAFFRTPRDCDRCAKASWIGREALRQVNLDYNMY